MQKSPATKPRVRFAPSPTGPLHVGSVRTALFNWLFAQKEGGIFVLRIEDTDQERSKPEYEREIIEALHWLQIIPEEGIWKEENGESLTSRGDLGPYRQSERTNIYARYLKQLLDKKRAYLCYCTKEELAAEREAFLAQGMPPRYSGHCRNLTAPPVGKIPQVIRLKIPGAQVEFKDLVRGTVSFDANLFGDLPIAKNLTSPLYNFAVVVDDFEMRITHVIRGEDHISNTPRQILVQKALEFHEPIYAHIPLILNQDRSKLSKRHAETSVLSYRDAGYLPEALLNFLALLGWHPRDDREVLSTVELVKEFDIKRVQKGGAIFNQEKLDWLNAQHLERLTVLELERRLRPFLTREGLRAEAPFLQKVIEAERGRFKTLEEFIPLAGFFFTLPSYPQTLLSWQEQKASKTEEILEAVKKSIATIPEAQFNRTSTASALQPLIDKEGRGPVFWPLRVAVSGLAASPDPLVIMEVLGQAETLHRLNIALKKFHEDR